MEISHLICFAAVLLSNVYVSPVFNINLICNLLSNHNLIVNFSTKQFEPLVHYHPREDQQTFAKPRPVLEMRPLAALLLLCPSKEYGYVHFFDLFLALSFLEH